MNGIRPILRLIAVSYYRWALREIDPMHPDLCYVIAKVAELEGGK